MAQSRVFLKGEICWEDEAMISPFSTGLLYGDGIFEVLRSYDGVPFMFPEHYSRLRSSCEALQLHLMYDEDNLWLITRELLRQNDATEGNGFIRITVFGSKLNDISSPNGLTTNTFAHVRQFSPPKAKKYNLGINARISSYRSSPYNPIAGHNTLCFLPMILSRRLAWERGIDEVLIQNTEGGICEGSTTNLFIVKNGKITTPPIKDGINLDVSRQLVIDLAREAKFTVSERRISQKMLLNSDEAFIVNSLIEVMPIREIDGNPIGEDGNAEPVAKLLLEAYHARVKAES
ncbi:aminotransferase class IV family protein [bacterium]|nr:aminotransferase class IV family protein [bacterium]